MNKKKSVLGICSGLMLMLVLGITSCTKEGAAGPKGDAGAAGATGATGPQGPAGNPGAPGTPANVYYSPWTDVTYAADTIHIGTTVDTVGYAATINAPKLVDSIINKGTIKVYWNVNTAAAPTIVALPYFENGMLFGAPLTVNTAFQSSRILLYANYNISTFTSSNQKVFQYRYILIPGIVTGRTSTVNWDDYSQVKKYLGLKD
jgi:hypothetical protein